MKKRIVVVVCCICSIGIAVVITAVYGVVFMLKYHRNVTVASSQITVVQNKMDDVVYEIVSSGEISALEEKIGEILQKSGCKYFISFEILQSDDSTTVRFHTNPAVPGDKLTLGYDYQVSGNQWILVREYFPSQQEYVRAENQQLFEGLIRLATISSIIIFFFMLSIFTIKKK